MQKLLLPFLKEHLLFVPSSSGGRLPAAEALEDVSSYIFPGVDKAHSVDQVAEDQSQVEVGQARLEAEVSDYLEGVFLLGSFVLVSL